MSHPRSEPAIFFAIDAVCGQVRCNLNGTLLLAMGHGQCGLTSPCHLCQAPLSGVGSAFQLRCSNLIRQHRDDLENEIYANGIDNVPRVLCNELSSSCALHALYDHGEL